MSTNAKGVVSASSSREGWSRKAVRSPKIVTSIFLGVAMTALLLSVSASAAPLPTHHLKETFGSAQQPSFASPFGLAVDQSNGDVLAIDKGGNEKQKVVFLPSSSQWVTGDTFKLKNLPSGCATETASINYSSATVTIKNNIANALATACSVTTASFATGGTASAGVTVEFKESFAGKALPLMQFEALSVTNPGASGTVERLASGNKPGVYRYKENGEPANFTSSGTNVIDSGGAIASSSLRSQVAVDNSGTATNGNIYVAESNATKELKIYDSAGNTLTSLTKYKAGPSASGAETTFGEGICGVAVGPEGAVYVAEFGPSGQIHKYVPSGAVPTVANNTLNIEGLENPCPVAAGAGLTAGSIFAYVGTGLNKYNATTGAFDYQLVASINGLSVDPVTGHVYAALSGSSEVLEQNASGGSPTEVSRTKTASLSRRRRGQRLHREHVYDPGG